MLTRREAPSIWFTGLPGAGKSTLAYRLAGIFNALKIKNQVIDAEEMRATFYPELGFTDYDRDLNIARIGDLARSFQVHGIITIIAAISPRRAIREATIANLDAIEVYVRCSIDELIKRDAKGLYAKAVKGDIKNFTGISAPYDEPTHPHITVDTDSQTIQACMVDIILYLTGLEWPES